MCEKSCQSSDHHHHHHGASEDNHRHDELKDSPGLLSRKERLIMRIEISLHHNKEHAGYYEKMAAEAAELGGEETARLIRAASELTARQNEKVEKALSLLRSL